MNNSGSENTEKIKNTTLSALRKTPSRQGVVRLASNIRITWILGLKLLNKSTLEKIGLAQSVLMKGDLVEDNIVFIFVCIPKLYSTG